jgi:hypothetical protein
MDVHATCNDNGQNCRARLSRSPILWVSGNGGPQSIFEFTPVRNAILHNTHDESLTGKSRVICQTTHPIHGSKLPNRVDTVYNDADKNDEWEDKDDTDKDGGYDENETKGEQEREESCGNLGNSGGKQNSKEEQLEKNHSFWAIWSNLFTYDHISGGLTSVCVDKL